VAISTAELAFRILVFLFVLVGVPLSFVLFFRAMDYAAHDGLVEQFRGRSALADTGKLDAYFENAAEDAIRCSICGAANGENYSFCHNCQEPLSG